MKNELIAVARISTPHGVRGEVKLQPLTDFPHRFETTKVLFLKNGAKMLLESARFQKGMVLAKFTGMDNPEVWLPYRHEELFVSEDELMPLPEGQFYIHQLIGIEVFEQDGAMVGAVTDVLQTGSNDVYVVKKSDGDELLLPAIDTVINRIEMKERRMVVTLPEYW